MKWRNLFAAVTALFVTMNVAYAQDTRPGIGVLAFANGGSFGLNAEDYQALEVGVQQFLMAELAQNSGLRIVDRSVIQQLMAEQDLGANGRVDAATAARIGKIIGARYMIMGGFMDVYGQFTLNGRIVDTETTEIVSAASVQKKREEIIPSIIELARQLSRETNLPALSRDAEQEQAAREELPEEAMNLYSRAVWYESRGLNDRAKQLFDRIEQEFPTLAASNEMLKQRASS